MNSRAPRMSVNVQLRCRVALWALATLAVIGACLLSAMPAAAQEVPTVEDPTTDAFSISDPGLTTRVIDGEEQVICGIVPPCFYYRNGEMIPVSDRALDPIDTEANLPEFVRLVGAIAGPLSELVIELFGGEQGRRVSRLVHAIEREVSGGNSSGTADQQPVVIWRRPVWGGPPVLWPVVGVPRVIASR